MGVAGVMTVESHEIQLFFYRKNGMFRGNGRTLAVGEIVFVGYSYLMFVKTITTMRI